MLFYSWWRKWILKIIINHCIVLKIKCWTGFLIINIKNKMLLKGNLMHFCFIFIWYVKQIKYKPSFTIFGHSNRPIAFKYFCHLSKWYWNTHICQDVTSCFTLFFLFYNFVFFTRSNNRLFNIINWIIKARHF